VSVFRREPAARESAIHALTARDRLIRERLVRKRPVRKPPVFEPIVCERPSRVEVRVPVLIGISVTAVMILLAVGIHYEALSLTSTGVRHLEFAQRVRVAIAVLAALVAHFAEIVLFAVGWKILLAAGVAELSIADPTFTEILYFSGSTYTSLGYGDIVPLGNAGLLAGSEALTGLVLIAWTASFSYFEMRAFWGSGRSR